jgi:hypothetical protein
MTVESIMMLCTTVMTLLFGGLAKKFGWLESTYLPIQNVLIGVLAGILCWLIGIDDNLLTSILICLTSSLCAGGAYDVSQVKRKTLEQADEEYDVSHYEGDE